MQSIVYTLETGIGDGHCRRALETGIGDGHWNIYINEFR